MTSLSLSLTLAPAAPHHQHLQINRRKTQHPHLWGHPEVERALAQPAMTVEHHLQGALTATSTTSSMLVLLGEGRKKLGRRLEESWKRCVRGLR